MGKMRAKRSLEAIKILALGAINGLLVGLVLEKARHTLLNYLASPAAQEGSAIGWTYDYIQALWGPYMALVYIPVFAIVAYLVNQYFKSRPTLLLSLWFGLGALALGAGYFMFTINPEVSSLVWCFSLVAVGYLAYRLWKRCPDSIALLWVVIGISAVVVIAFVILLEPTSPSHWSLFLFAVVSINAIYGTVIHIVVHRFSKRKLTHAD
jgi:hypothetical protein